MNSRSVSLLAGDLAAAQEAESSQQEPTYDCNKPMIFPDINDGAWPLIVKASQCSLNESKPSADVIPSSPLRRISSSQSDRPTSPRDSSEKRKDRSSSDPNPPLSSEFLLYAFRLAV